MFKKSILFAVVFSLVVAIPAFADMDAAAKFFDGLSVKSDIRVRYEGIFDDEIGGNANMIGYGGNLNDRSRGRYRLRIGFTKQVNDEIMVGVRFATGGQGVTSTNQSFNDNFGNDEFDLDKAYITWSPAWVSGLELTAGKMGNPFFLNKSWLVWDSDVTPEGTAQSYTFEFSNIEFTYTQAQFFLDETNQRYTHVAAGTGDVPREDAYMLGFQFGGDYDGSTVDLGLHAAYYDFKHCENAGLTGNGNTTIGTAVSPTAAATFGVRPEYEIFDLIGYAKFDLGLPVQITADWATNLSDQPVGVAGNPRDDEDDAFLIRLDVNKASNPGDWAFSYTYAFVEADAVVEGLTDSDFTACSLNGFAGAGAGARGRSRSTNVEGHRFNLSYVLLKNTTVGVMYQITEVENELLAKRQDGVTDGTAIGGGTISNWSIPDRQVVQIDMNVKW